MVLKVSWRCGLGFLLLAAVSGCGAQRVPVKGVVTLDSQPVEGAIVQFLSEKTGVQVGFGVTDSDGNFEVGYLTPGEGLLPGTYLVTVVKSKEVVDSPEQAQKVKRQRIDAPMRKNPQKGLPQTKSELPDLYAMPAATPFHVTVPTEGLVKLELDSKAKSPTPAAGPRPAASAPVPMSPPAFRPSASQPRRPAPPPFTPPR